MTLDKDTKFKIINRYKQTLRSYSLGQLTTYLTERDNLKRTVETIMLNPIKLGNFLKSAQTKDCKDLNYTFDFPANTISRTCLYLAACCFINKTSEVCKLLVEELIDTYDISIENSTAKESTKDILKEIVNITVNKYEALFNEVVEEQGIM